MAILVLVGSSSAWAQSAIVADNVRANLRSGKAENYRVIRVLPAKTQVEVLATEQDYAKVRTGDGQVGWLLVKLLKDEDTDPSAQAPEALEAAQHQLSAAHDELARVQGELERERNRPRGEPALIVLVATAFGALAAGIALGMLILQGYYRKRLHGLRI